MPISYSYAIDGLDTRTVEGEADIVTCVRCRLSGVGGGATASAAFSVDIPAEGGPYKPFAELTQADVEAWVKTALGDDLSPIQQEIAERLALPVPEGKTPPWVPTPSIGTSIDDLV